MKVQLTFFFESVQQATKYASASLGWTETWFADDPTEASLDGFFNDVDTLNYIQLRLACMPATYRLAWLRISDELNPRSFKVQAIDNGIGTAVAGSSILGIPAQVFGQVQCALLVDLARLPDDANDHTHHRKFLMRALPVDIINGNIINPNGPNWRSILFFLNWLAVKESGNIAHGPTPVGTAPNFALGLRYQDPAAAAYTPTPAVVNAVGTSNRDISVAAVLGGTPGVTKYTFKDFPDEVRALNRTWRLLTTQAGPPAASVLGRTRRPTSEINYTPPGPGRHRMVVPKYGIFNQYTIIGLRSKKTGRLFRQLRGRSSNR